MRKKIDMHLDMPSALLLTVLLALTVGVGAVLSNTLPPAEYGRIAQNIQHYVENVPTDPLVRADVFKECVFKYEKFVVFIWASGFVPPGAVVSLCLMLIKGVGLGFTSGFFIREFGVEGLSYIARYYLLQNIFLIPAYLFLTYNNIAFVLKRFSKGRSPMYTKADIMEYFVVAAVCSAVVMVACLIEAFL